MGFHNYPLGMEAHVEKERFGYEFVFTRILADRYSGFHAFTKRNFNLTNILYQNQNYNCKQSNRRLAIGFNMAARSLVMSQFELLTSGVVTSSMFVVVMVVEAVEFVVV